MSSNLHKHLTKQFEQISNTTDRLLETTKDWQLIKQYVNNRIDKIKLNDRQQQKLQRYQFVYNQLSSGKYTEQNVLSQLCDHFGVEIVTAYADMNCAKEIFSSFVNINKKFEIKIQLEINKKMMAKAIEIQDTKNYAILEKNRIELLKQIEDQENAPGELFEGHTIIAEFNPSLLGVPAVNVKELMKAINEKRSVKIKTDLFEDINFEEIKQDE